MPDPASTSVNFSEPSAGGLAGWPPDFAGAAGSGGADGDFSQAARSAAVASQRIRTRFFIVSFPGVGGRRGGRRPRERIRDAHAAELLAVAHRLRRVAEDVDPFAARGDGGDAALDEQRLLGVEG